MQFYNTLLRGESRPSLYWKGLFFIARSSRLYQAAPPGAAQRAREIAQVVTLRVETPVRTLPLPGAAWASSGHVTIRLMSQPSLPFLTFATKTGAHRQKEDAAFFCPCSFDRAVTSRASGCNARLLKMCVGNSYHDRDSPDIVTVPASANIKFSGQKDRPFSRPTPTRNGHKCCCHPGFSLSSL